MCSHPQHLPWSLKSEHDTHRASSSASTLSIFVSATVRITVFRTTVFRSTVVGTTLERKLIYVQSVSISVLWDEEFDIAYIYISSSEHIIDIHLTAVVDRRRAKHIRRYNGRYYYTPRFYSAFGSRTEKSVGSNCCCG